MPVARYSFANPLPRLKSFLVSRFETRPARFRIAVSSGFVIAAVGFLVVGAGSKFGVAETIWGIMNVPGLGDPVTYQAPPPDPSAQYRTERRHHARADDDETDHHRRKRHTHLASHEGDQPVQLVRQSMCVRLCDGFAFPVGNYYGDGDRAAHEATCQSECPGAKTALYVLPTGSDSIGDATQVSTGLNYSKLPDAFHYTTYVDETCSCHPQGGSRIKSLLRDFTLRRGDTVMTSKGLQVFHGGAGFPFKRRDFVALSRSRDIQQATRTSLKAIERASLVGSTTVAVRVAPTVKARPAMTSDAGRGKTKDLQRQARY